MHICMYLYMYIYVSLVSMTRETHPASYWLRRPADPWKRRTLTETPWRYISARGKRFPVSWRQGSLHRRRTDGAAAAPPRPVPAPALSGGDLSAAAGTIWLRRSRKPGHALWHSPRTPWSSLRHFDGAPAIPSDTEMFELISLMNKKGQRTLA